MRCPHCQAENACGLRFCESCGTALARACPSCGHELKPQAKFCGKCGAPIVERRQSTVESLRPASALNQHEPRTRLTTEVGERRHLTVLFCDLVGSTQIAARMDPEEWRDIAARYQRTAADCVQRFGGQVAKFLGDGVVCFFGWPQAHDAAAERAVRAGLAMVEAVRVLKNPPVSPFFKGGQESAPPFEKGGPGEISSDTAILHVRVGIHTGPVVVGRGGGDAPDVFGETPNLAARVQAAAEVDTVLITAATHQLVAGLFVVEERGPQPLKGIAAPVVLYRVAQASGVRGRLAAAASAHTLTPFVGRERERQTLAEAWERAQDGEGQVVLIVGEPGIGKSRLVQEFKADLGQTPHTWIESGGAAYYETTPFHVVIDLLRQGFGWTADLSTEARLDALDQALAVVGLTPAEAAPLVAPLLDLPLPEGRYPPLFLSPEQQRRRLLTTMSTWVFTGSRLQANVIVVEDLQWVDPSTLELLGLLVEQGARERLLLVLTARPEFRPPWPLRAHHTQLNLNRLTKRQVHEMIVRVGARLIPPGEMLEALAVRTDGVPLFVEELTRAMLEAEGAALVTREIPATLQDTLMARLDRLGSAKEVAQTAAVLGREFTYGLLRAVSPLAEEALQAALATLTDAELVYARGLPPEATYLFKHALVQHTAYDSLLKSRRRELDRAVAEALTGRFAAVAEAQPEVVAQHWESAGEAARAITAWEQAGERAKARSAMVEAERHYRRALAVLATLPDSPGRAAQEMALQIALALIVYLTCGFASAETERIANRVRELSAQTGDIRQLVISLTLAWVLSLSRGESQGALGLAGEVLVAARNDGSNFALTWGHFALGQSQYLLGDLCAAGEHAQEALRYYREEDYRGSPSDLGTLAHPLLAYVLAHCGFPERAQAEIHKLLALAERLEIASQRTLGLVSAASAHAYLHNVSSVAAHADRLLGIAVAHQLPQYAAWGHILGGWAIALKGQTDGGIAELREGLASYAATGQRTALGLYLGLLAEAQLLGGQVRDGLTTIEQALAAVSEERIFLPELLRLRGELRAAAGADLATVEASFREAIALAREIGTKLYELRATTSLARCLARHGRTDEARAALAPLYASFTEGFDTPDLVEAKAVLEELEGPPVCGELP
jgi:class 3 adenylate cyclase/tetratricopeptide (TPR) repeat protein